MFFINWSVPDYHFTRPIIDMRPYYIIHDEKKATIVLNALGVRNEDITIDIVHEGECDYLVVCGESKNEEVNRTFSTNCKFEINSDAVESINWDSKDGVITIIINYKVPEKKNIPINRG